MNFFSGYAHNRRQRIALQGLAVFFAALYVLSAVRGFVPGMCATQSAMAKRNPANYSQSCALESPQVCCAKASQNTPVTSEGDAPVPAASCVFCMLAKARMEVPEQYHFEVPTFAPLIAPATQSVVLSSAETLFLLRDRAPPA